MAANELDLSYSEIRDVAANAVMWPTPANWNSKHSNVFANAVKRGSRRFYYQATIPGESTPHTWSFLEPLGTIQTVLPHTTGTVSSPGGDDLVTFTSALPSWYEQGDLWVADSSGVTHRLSMATAVDEGSNQYTLGAAEDITISSGTTFTLRRHYYDLPDNYTGMRSDSITYRRDQQTLGEIELVNEQEIRRHDDDGIVGEPRFAAVVNRPYTIEDGSNEIPRTKIEPTRYRLLLYPIPNKVLHLDYRYTAVPPLLDGATDLYAWGSVPHAEALLESIVSQLMIMARDDYSREETYMAALMTAVKHDRKVNSKHTLGYGSESLGRPDYRNPQTLRDYLRYKGRGVPYANITWS